MILFIGSEEKGYFVREIAGKHGWESAFVEPELDIEKQVPEILRYQGAKLVVYDIGQYGIPGREIADVICRIKKANNAKPVIYAEGYHPQMSIIMELAYQGIEQFIFGSMLAEKKEELEQCIRGTRTLLEYDMKVEEKAEAGAEAGTTARTIAVAGAVPRMGTTTQAIQFVKYLLLKGYRACYIELNGHGWVKELREAYAGVEVEEGIGRATYADVDMYDKPEKLPEVLRKGYDFYVYDYGVYSERGFNKVSFLEKDFQVFTVGTKPGEFMKTYELIENNFYNQVSYIFSFIQEDEEERQDTYDLMQEKRSATYFATDCRDPFRFSGSDIYERMLPLETVRKDKAPVKKRGLFGRKEKGQRAERRAIACRS